MSCFVLCGRVVLLCPVLTLGLPHQIMDRGQKLPLAAEASATGLCVGDGSFQVVLILNMAELKERQESLSSGICIPKLAYSEEFICVISFVFAITSIFLISFIFVITFIFAVLYLPSLALLDYVSRAHEIAICPSSVRPSVRRPSSVVRPCRNYELKARISFKF